MITITMGRGFHLDFDNMVTVSVQFGHGNYCERRDQSDDNAEDGLLSSSGRGNCRMGS